MHHTISFPYNFSYATHNRFSKLCEFSLVKFALWKLLQWGPWSPPEVTTVQNHCDVYMPTDEHMYTYMYIIMVYTYTHHKCTQYICTSCISPYNTKFWREKFWRIWHKYMWNGKLSFSAQLRWN